MVFPLPVLRLVLSGPLYTSERWSTSLHLWDPPGGGEPPTTVSAGLIAACSALINHQAFSTSQGIDTIKLNEIGTDGLYTSSTTVEHLYEEAVMGTSSPQPAPQLSLVASLMTSAARGYANRGRMFLPAPVYSLTLAQDGRINAGDQAEVLGLVTTFLNAINDELDPYRVVIASKVGAGYIREVKSVRIGRVIDTVRSRRSSTLEDYLTGTTLTAYGDHGRTGGGGSW